MGGIAGPRRLARRGFGWRTRVCASVLCAALAVQPVLAQAPGQAKPEPGQSAPTRLQIQVLTPVPMLEPAGALSANRVTVQVLDGWGMPVPGAAVSFRLPEAGPGGAFLNGLSTEVAIADREGKAAVQGFDWRPEAGTSFLHVIAAYGDIRAGAMVEVQLDRKVKDPPPTASAAGASPSAAPTAVPPSAFPLPEESRIVRQTAAPTDHIGRQTAAPTDHIVRQTAAPTGEPPQERSSGRAAIGQNRTKSQVPSPPARAAAPNPGVPSPAAPAPRETVPSAPPADYQAPGVVDTGSYVTVKRKSGGSRKWMLLLVVAAAAAGGAVAAVAGSGGSASSGGNGSGGTTPGSITIGSPSISVTGGAN